MPQNLGDMEWLTKLQELAKLGGELSYMVIQLTTEDNATWEDILAKAYEFRERQEKP